LDAGAVIQEYQTASRKNQSYQLKQLTTKVTGGRDYQSIVEDLIKLLRKLNEAKMIKSLTTSAFYLSESLLSDT
jgi:hypothetical protein